MMTPGASGRSDELTRVMTGIYALRHHFRSLDITPAILELSTPEDGARLLSALDREHRCYVEAGMTEDGQHRRQVTIEGVIVRWPTWKVALPGGGFAHRP